MNEVDLLAKKVWDYHRLHQNLEKADLIMVLGSHDVSIADYGVELFRRGYAPLMLFTGGVIHNKPAMGIFFDKPEGEMFAERALGAGIPQDRILVENKSKNTGENFQFARKLLEEKGLPFEKVLLVQKPYMERRTFATGRVQWPDKEIIVTSPETTYEKYMHGDLPKDPIINIMVGDLQRIKVYGENGFQLRQEIPQDVWKAYEELVRLGYNKRLLS
jgi:uncharacterized SAM-binding protein YcdF (DUF218 family)